jgi:uncharacterized membrane protein
MHFSFAHFNLFTWLFTDPVTAGSETFHFTWPWLIFCLAGLLVTFYYSVEGRKRFVKNRPILKYMFDRYLGWFAVLCFIGLPILAARLYLDGYFFAWRVWRYLWLVALVVWAITWIVYMVRKYPQEQANFVAYQKRQQYMPKSNKRNVRAASR